MKISMKGAILAIAMIGIPMALASPASATVTIVSETPPTTPFTLPSGALLLNLNDLTPGSQTNTTSHGVGINFQPDSLVASGSQSGLYAAPYIYDGNGIPFGDSDGQDTTPYLSTGVGSITLTLPNDVMNFGLLWGSVDAYNTIQFWDMNQPVGQQLVGSFTGDQILNPANGDQGVNGSVYVQLLSDKAFNQIRMQSNQYAFEFDNLAFGGSNPVPEPVTLSLMGAGLMGIYANRRKKHIKKDELLRNKIAAA